jgi:hypothetical protein
MALVDTFCSCIKKVSKSIPTRRVKKYDRRKSRRTATAVLKEQAAIAICTKTVLGKRGKTLKRFTCRKGPMLETQKPIH